MTMQAVRFALVGCGAWGSHHARAIASLPEARLAAIVERNPESRQQAQAEHPEVRVFADHREMLSGVEVDAVDVVLPTHLHHEVGMDVLAAGKHLLMEKPLASTIPQCAALVAEAGRRGKLLAVGHEFRLSALWGKVKELIAAGEIGEPLYGLIELWRNPYRLGSEGWRYDIRRVGNWILEEPIHFFDLARWYFAGVGEPVSVFAQANGLRPDRPELQDNFTAMLQYPAGRYVVVAQTLAGWEHHQVVKITGTRGALWASWSGAKDRTFEPTFWLKLMRGDQVQEVPIARMSGEVYELVDEIAVFARAIHGQGVPACTGEDGRWSVAMCLKAQESVDTGKIVPLDDLP
jgi:myo-inositol 2-dehydrogenase/D-chiro-inositol 1-dehydrogenase